MVEKPSPDQAPSNLAVVGRYVLPGTIFDQLEATTPGSGGEIQLTDAMEALLTEQSMLALPFAGTRFDCGNKTGLVEATLEMALRDAEVAPALRRWMANTSQT